jgi:hypothetical protein
MKITIKLVIQAAGAVRVTSLYSSNLKWCQQMYEAAQYLSYESKYTVLLRVTLKSVENEITHTVGRQPFIVRFLCHQVQTHLYLNMT